MSDGEKLISPTLMKQIRENPALSAHHRTVFMFLSYLRTTAACSFKIYGDGCDVDGPFDIEKQIEYIHRWTDLYRSGVLAKFYQLENWLKNNPAPVTMLTLTTYQDGRYSTTVKGDIVTIPESFDTLKTSWKRLRMALRLYLPSNRYVWIMEPHKTGYPHLHVIIFEDVNKETQDAISRLWSKKYKAGSADHGVNFAIKTPDESIRSIRNYLMKYVAKGFSSTGSKFEDGHTWGTGELVFNALVWKHKWRIFGASRSLSKVMRHKKKSEVNVLRIYFGTELWDANGETHTTWLKEGYKIPEPFIPDTEKSF